MVQIKRLVDFILIFDESKILLVCACISSCFLSYDCQTGIGLESINVADIPSKKRRRNHQLKFVIESQDLLSHYSHSVDLTKNDGMTAKQLIKSTDNNKLVGLVLS